MADTRPLLSTVAMPLSLLLHAPVPDPSTTLLAEYVADDPTQSGLVPVTEAILETSQLPAPNSLNELRPVTVKVFEPVVYVG